MRYLTQSQKNKVRNELATDILTVASPQLLQEFAQSILENGSARFQKGAVADAASGIVDKRTRKAIAHHSKSLLTRFSLWEAYAQRTLK